MFSSKIGLRAHCVYAVEPVVGLRLGVPKARPKRGALMTSSYSANLDKHV